MATVSTTLPSDGQTIDASDVNTPINAILSEFNGNIDNDNIKTGANINGAKLLASSLPGSSFDTTLAGGWISGGLPAYSSATNNGNKSYDIVFASTVASLLSPGMRLRTTRTVTAPTYMGGAFNGSSHYFTKTTCTGTLSTVANNFTIMAWVQPTSYAAGFICGRGDSTPNNSFNIKMESDGRVTLGINNAGGANFRNVSTYQSLPLNKKTHIAASWASGTVVIYFDGVSVPVATASSGGTAPTVAGTGGDFSIGRLGAYNSTYYAGYAGGFGVFDAVLSAATIRSYMSQVLSGSETNCIGAWSLNNTGVNQQAAGTNDLTATGGVSYTSGLSPYGTDSNGVSAGTTDYELVMKVNGATATVQVPEGCTIPTSGGVSAVAYSTTANPYGFTTDKGRWGVESLYIAGASQSSPVAGTWYNLASAKLAKPVGAFAVGYEASIAFASTNAAPLVYTTLSTANNTNSDSRNSSYATGTSTGTVTVLFKRDCDTTGVTSATDYYLNSSQAGTGAGTYALTANGVPSKITAIPAGV